MDAADIIAQLKALGVSHDDIAAKISRDRTAATRMMNGGRAMKLSEVPLLEALIQERSPAGDAKIRDVTAQTPNFHAWPKTVPVHGTALGGDLEIDDVTRDMQVEQTVLEVSDTIELVRRPPVFSNNRDLYAVYVAGSSMEPRYEPGDLLYVDPRRPPAIGDDVVVQLRDGNGHDGDDRVICALIKRLVRRNAGSVELEQYNPPLRFKIASRHIAEVHRVVKLGEVVGV